MTTQNGTLNTQLNNAKNEITELKSKVSTLESADLTTKMIIQDVDINTLTEEGNFFVESGNLDHFPAGYRNQWYFLNVTNAVGANRIKQTVMPDNSGSMGWTMTRTGSYNTDTHIAEWESWLISDFANGKLLKSK